MLGRKSRPRIDVTVAMQPDVGELRMLEANVLVEGSVGDVVVVDNVVVVFWLVEAVGIMVEIIVTV